jgi:undecaprenyl-diphosphatase
VSGVPIVPEIRLLVGCGGGMSFPSSHAVNNIATATLLGWYYPRGRPWMFLWATVVAISRSFVGLHYPSDVLGGAVLGILIGLFVVWAWTRLQQQFLPRWGIQPRAKGAA